MHEEAKVHCAFLQVVAAWIGAQPQLIHIKARMAYDPVLMSSAIYIHSPVKLFDSCLLNSLGHMQLSPNEDRFFQLLHDILLNVTIVFTDDQVRPRFGICCMNNQNINYRARSKLELKA